LNKLQRSIISVLKKDTSVYPHNVSKIDFEETHISWILLTGKYAYKIKKELKFGNVLNFSNLQLRKKYCQREVSLNKFLCNEMYRGVVKIINENGLPRFAELGHKGKPLDYAVKMREIPQKYRMDNLLRQNKVNKKTIDKLASILVRFHKKTPTSPKIKKFGQPRFILKKINENFRTLDTLAKIDPKYEEKMMSFVKDNGDLFLRRIKENKVRNIHGDLYLKNIFVDKNSKFYLYDRIEFNEELRSADIAEDVAHFSMDLDFHRKSNLRRYFLEQYLKKTNDFGLELLVYFWMCYKACMRAKVCLFQAKNEQNKAKKLKLRKDARRFFKLAESYLKFF
jgi:aminoglycoside phosphotransferase family enzyme